MGRGSERREGRKVWMSTAALNYSRESHLSVAQQCPPVLARHHVGRHTSLRGLQCQCPGCTPRARPGAQTHVPLPSHPRQTRTAGCAGSCVQRAGCGDETASCPLVHGQRQKEESNKTSIRPETTNKQTKKKPSRAQGHAVLLSQSQKKYPHSHKTDTRAHGHTNADTHTRARRHD